MKKAFTLARECMGTQAETRAFRYNLRVKAKEFQPNVMVWYHYPRKTQGMKSKCMSPYVGPYRVIEKLGPVLYRIKKSDGAQPKIVYVDTLKPCYEDEIPEPVTGTRDEALTDLCLDALYNSADEDPVPRPRRENRPPRRYGYED